MNYFPHPYTIRVCSIYCNNRFCYGVMKLVLSPIRQHPWLYLLFFFPFLALGFALFVLLDTVSGELASSEEDGGTSESSF